MIGPDRDLMTGQEAFGRRGAPDERRTALFCLRADSDVDHVVPVIDALAHRGGHAIRVIVYDPIKTFRKDFRLRYLRQRHGLAVEHLMDLPGVSLVHRYETALLRLLFAALLTAERRCPWPPMARLLRSTLFRIRAALQTRCGSRDVVEALVTQVEAIEQGVVMFDHTINPLAEAATTAARRRGIATIALPHSVPHLSDLPREAVVGAEGATDWGALYDWVILPNAATAARFSEDCGDDSVIRILGSARFSQAWGAVLDGITPRFKWQAGGTKVLFILSKKGPYVDWAEVNRVVAHLCRDERLAVCVKPHPRTEVSGLPQVTHSRNFAVAGADVPTASLVQWADLVLFWGSSVVYDALRLRKPTLHLAYLFRLHFDFEPFIQSWRVGSFEEFTQRLNAFIEIGELTYCEAEAAACMNALVERAETPAPERYADFLSQQLDAPRVPGPVTDCATESRAGRAVAP
jgi:hypothetical protein